jgi:hypothetical protein
MEPTSITSWSVIFEFAIPGAGLATSEWFKARKSLTGAYFWVPRPKSDCIACDLVTCHDLEAWEAISHREFRPLILEVLAKNWTQDLRTMTHQLYDHYTGLPHGRIAHRKPGSLVIHGDDAPMANWLELVKGRFRLSAVSTFSEYTEREQMLAKDLKAVQEPLGNSLNLKTRA